MAALTWRNVDAPDFSVSLNGIRAAGDFFNQAISGAQSAVGQIDSKMSDRVNSAFQTALLQYEDADELKAALAADPTLGADSRRLNAESLGMASNRIGQLLNNALTEGQIERNAFQLGVDQREESEIQAANRAAPIVAQAVGLARGGKIDEANKLMEGNPDIFRGVGYKDLIEFGDNVFGGYKDSVGVRGDLQNQEIQRGDYGMRVDNHRFTIEDRRIAADAAALYNQVLSQGDNPESWLAALERNSQGADPRVVAAARGMITGEVGNLYLPSGGGESGETAGGGISGGSAASFFGGEDAASVLRKFEDFRGEPYWDVNHHRVGYGSDTVTLADGRVMKTTRGMKITRADAERDLNRRIGLIENTASRLGGKGWDNLPEGARSAVISVTYNYGEGSKRLAPLWKAVQSGDANQVARVIQGFAGDNDGVNRNRRLREAALAAGSTASSPESRGSQARAARAQQGVGEASRWAEGSESTQFALEVARDIKKTDFPGTKVAWLNDRINQIMKDSMVDGQPTITAKQAGDLLIKHARKAKVPGLTERISDTFFESNFTNIGGGLAIDDRALRNEVDLIKRGKNLTREVTVQNSAALEASVNQAQETERRLGARVGQLRRSVIGGRTGLKNELARAEQEYAAAILARKAAEEEFNKSKATKPNLKREEPNSDKSFWESLPDLFTVKRGKYN